MVTWQAQRMRVWQLPGVRMSEIRCSIRVHLPWDRFLLLSHQLLPSFMKSLKSSALPYQERGRLRLMKRLDMLNSLPAAGKCLHPKLNTEMCQYNACILSEGFLGTYRYMLCVFRCPLMSAGRCPNSPDISTGPQSSSWLEWHLSTPRSSLNRHSSKGMPETSTH